MREFLEIFFRREGHEVVTVGDVDSALVAIENDDFDLVVSDIQLPERSGLELLREARAISPETVFVMITAYASTETAVEAMREGAYDYITKPFKVEEIRLTVEKALEKRLLRTENQRLKTELRSQKRERSIVGNSAAIQRVFDLVDQVAETKTNVLICGESGTGKELVARAIHDRSQRSEAPFVAINCGAIPENLLESELFGHVKGAFTGAVQNKAGLFEAASKGTLFLDEIGELSLALQVKLLRALQEKRIRRVGGIGDEAVDVRILAATNQNLEEAVAAGRFREDLYYRLNVIQVTLPPLRERVDDIPLLVLHFVEKYSRELDRKIASVSEAALQRLADYAFPGNVRELENVIERAVALTREDTIGVDALPPNVLRPAVAAPVSRITRDGVDLDGLMASYEKGLLSEALEKSGGVKKRAAALLGISFRSFRYRLEKLRLEDLDEAE
ncbi:MAG: sigma-54-dependent Fis family transcriptional regulator [Deltaproteobacteria bacterium]|nr:sigma-54-dependent Fis family transcriptional regulator [Deltaproteobacteria bacterium]MBW2447713.1 sigma-54-dependent Fis family transcriptional regulator [Deltaproteobacteria bacterium]